MSQHTVWKVNTLKETDRHGEYERYEVRENGFGPLICDVFRVGEQGKEYANLIAAAPDLLAALKAAKDTIKCWHNMPFKDEKAWVLYQNSPEMKQINAALRRAEEGG